jgi:cell division protein FtsB
MIGVFEMVVLIVLIGTIGKIVSKRMALPKATPAADAENQRLQAEVARLNERIHVLERLATDPAKRLSDEIESLKDK